MSDRRKGRAADSAALARARGELARTRGKRWLEIVLDAPDPAALVRSLPADELYLAIREIGLGEAAELVRLASPEQFRVFVDLDAWRRSELDPRNVLPWIRAARAGALSSEEAGRAWHRKLSALDPEVLSLVLRSVLVVHDLEENPDPELNSDRFIRTPEGKYLLEFTVAGTDYVAARGIIDDLYADDPFRATRLLEGLRWELDSELAESALRWRTGRLADLGYPSVDEALSWFARPPAAPAAAPGIPTRPAGFWLQTLARGSLLDRAAALVPDAARARIELQIVAAANAVLVADAVDVSDVEAVRRAFEAGRAYIEMGLEAQAAGAGEEEAAAVLAATPVKRIFQSGFGRVLELKRRAERLFAGGGAGTRDAPFLDPPLGEAIAALARNRPLYFPGLEADRDAWGTLAAAAFVPRHFLGSAELARTADALAMAEELVDLARRLGLAPAGGNGPFTPRLSALYLTALANERLGRTFSPDAISAVELAKAARALARIEDPRLAGAGAAGSLLERLARSHAEELARVRDGEAVPPEAITALRVRG